MTTAPGAPALARGRDACWPSAGGRPCGSGDTLVVRPTRPRMVAGEEAVEVVDVQEAKTHLSRLLDRVAAGAEIILARAGTPVARLPVARRRLDAFEGTAS